MVPLWTLPIAIATGSYLRCHTRVLLFSDSCSVFNVPPRLLFVVQTSCACYIFASVSVSVRLCPCGFRLLPLGNCIILKPSEKVPLTLQRYVFRFSLSSGVFCA